MADTRERDKKIMFFILLLLLALYVALSGKDTSAYDEFCRIECWSERRPCCLTS